MSSGEGVWSFGYGSNMDMVALRERKRVEVLEHLPAILGGFRLTFSLQGANYVEPAFGGLTREEGAEVHGIAFKMTNESVAQLDRNEGGTSAYRHETVTLTAYDGRQLEGYVYMPNKAIQERAEEYLPSSRYLGVLCKGARQAGLDPAYIEKLAARPVYSSRDHPEVALAREGRERARAGLREVGREELLEHKEGVTWVSCLGFVVSVPTVANFSSHKGRDMTSRALMQHHGIGLDANDDGGAPPYPLVASLSEEELEYITCWLDYYHVGKGGQLVGFHKEFREQQEQGSTDFVLPPIPQ